MSLLDYYKAKWSKKSTDQPWWKREIDMLDFDDKEYEGRSVSNTRELLGHHASGERQFGSGPVGVLNKANAELARLLNAVLNSEGEEEENVLSIEWATGGSGGTNLPGSKRILLSPTPIVGAGGTEDHTTDPKIMDGVGGQALMAATMQRTMSHATIRESAADQSQLAPLNRILWKAAETAYAKGELLRDWPGFAPYVKRHQQITCSDQAHAQSYVDGASDRLSALVVAAAWTLTNPSLPLVLNAQFKDLVDQCLNEVGAWKAKSRRYANSVELVNAWGKVLAETPPPPPPPQPSKPGPSKEEDRKPDEKGDEGEPQPAKEPQDKGEPSDTAQQESEAGESEEKGGTSNEAESEGSESGEGDQPGGDSMGSTADESGTGEPQGGQSPEEPKLSDDSLFGESVASTLNSNAVPNKFSLVTDIDDLEDLIPVGCGTIDEVEWHKPPALDSHKKARYSKRVIESRHITSAVQSALRFRASAPSWPIHGLESGDLDEGSLDKLALRERHPAMFERMECSGLPDVAIAILVDESTSMSYDDKSTHAIIVCLGIAEALRRMPGIHLMVHGFWQGDDNKTDMSEYMRSSQDSTEALMNIGCKGLTPLGYAIEASIGRLEEVHGNSTQKFVITLTDGLPSARASGCGYSDEPARDHVRKVCDWGYRRHRIRTLGIGIGGQPEDAIGWEMFGRESFVCLPDVLGAARIIASFLSKVAAKRA